MSLWNRTPRPPLQRFSHGPRAQLAATRAIVATLVLLAAQGASAREQRLYGKLLLDGVETSIQWVDGDSVRITYGPLEGVVARLIGFNTLEAFGPVHRWGTWSREELLELAHASTLAASKQTWRCSRLAAEDAYGRPLFDCPALSRHLVGAGLAMVFAVDGKPAPELLRLQRAARTSRLGMWAKGTPRHLVTSLHSRGEGEQTYDRVVDVESGLARKRPHHRTYRTCQEVCTGRGAGRSCMVYVPFANRYRRRPDCLQPTSPAP